MKKQLLVLFLIFFSSLFPIEKRWKRIAEIDAESGFYDSAIVAYSSVDPSLLELWEQDILNNNRALMTFKLQNYRDALKNFRQIELHQNRSPFLDSHLYWNQTLTFLLLAEEEFNQNRPEGRNYLKKAKQSLQKAEEKRCELEKMIGNQLCPPFRSKKEVHKKIEQLLSQGYRVARQASLSNFTLAEDLLALKERLRFFSSQLDAIQKEKIDYPAISIAYGQDAPLWQAALSQMKITKQRERLLSIAEKYLALITALKNSEPEKAKKSVDAARKELEQFYATLPKKERLAAELKEVKRALLRSLDRTHLDERAYLSFKKEYGDVLKVAEEEVTVLEQTRMSINQSWSDFKQGQEVFAKFYIKNATFPVDEAIKQLQDTSADDYKVILADALKNEKRSEGLLPLYQEAIAQGEKNDQATELIQSYQQEAIKQGDKFIQAVAKWQKELYSNTSQKELCLYQPWNEALPLFYRGFLHAVEAREAFKSNQLSFDKVDWEQSNSIKDWESVQNLIKNYEPKSPEEKKENTDTLTRSVIQMTLRDLSKKPLPQPVGEGGKPW